MGATLDLPFDRHAERNSYRRQLVTFEQRLRDLSLTLDQLKDSVERGLRTLNQRKEKLRDSDERAGGGEHARGSGGGEPGGRAGGDSGTG
jgi:hypothetical protein